ncbi:MAG: hypothetical protein HW373_1019, partial [Deltaproteobacteria bacterium]|nr:hypothetical protein [Deltaproteobacteria bacterium]
MPHIDFYSSCKRTYNKRVTDQVTLLNFFFTSAVTITKNIAVPIVRAVQWFDRLTMTGWSSARPDSSTGSQLKAGDHDLPSGVSLSQY